MREKQNSQAQWLEWSANCSPVVFFPALRFFQSAQLISSRFLRSCQESHGRWTARIESSWLVFGQ